MSDKKEVEINKMSNPYEKDILNFLKTNGKCVYGDIIKELKISATKGQEAIFSLINKGFIKHKEKSSYIELNVDLK
ncbi:MAG: winged helix-turn-helix transcriptional regulator [Draconibacterium sp.]